MSCPVVDILIRNDKAAALEALRNLWSYRLLEVFDNGSECYERITVCLHGAVISEPACVTVRILETTTLKLFA
ncbi:hypothetical protein TELCIR_26117 [Teladorsagia circumcincta]|uniref:Uncharacterized protein n=1 Tax=Teladorsagia circumcincta TaxID=45464 RepID=A0A2G9T3T6_TELCI|nr:hypothetical protein TELCIR_26117 [Teladorsagia circumcincta]